MKLALLTLSLFGLQSFGFSPIAQQSRPTSTLKASNANELVPMRQGSSVAIVTPMTEAGGIDLQALRMLLQMHVEAGTDNLCILGTTGEASVMTMEERAAVLKTAVQVVKGKIPILVGTGTINPNSVKAMTQQAIDLGCDASLVVSPYYVKPPQRGLIKHFTDMADLGLPVVVYNIPGRAGIDLKDENMALLSQHENIVGLKDATGDLNRLKSIKSLVPNSDDLLVYSGDDGTSLDFIRQGGDGCISVTANLAPRSMHEMMMAALDGDYEKATAINDRLDILHQKLFVESNPIPAKWALKRLGKIPTGFCRPPLDELDPQFQPVIEQALREARLLRFPDEPKKLFVPKLADIEEPAIHA